LPAIASVAREEVNASAEEAAVESRRGRLGDPIESQLLEGKKKTV